MRVRAIASATERSNAIGVVELDCTPHGLVLAFLGVGAFSEGYAPAALASGVQLTVPWSAVGAASSDGDQVYLELDWPGLPHDRLTLTRFSLGNADHPLELRRQRLVVQASAIAAAVLASLLAAAIVPRLSIQATAALTLSVGAASALTVLALGLWIDQRLFGSPLQESALREAFLADLVGYFPNLTRTNHAPKPRSKGRKLPNLAGFLPRSATVIAITLSAGIVAALGTTRHLLRLSETPLVATHSMVPAPPPADVDPALSPATTGPSAGDLDPGPADDPRDPTARRATSVTTGERCTCERASSPLWDQPIPTLSMLLLEASAIPGRTGSRTRLEVAIVNNGNRPLEEITLHVFFFEGEGQSRRETAERPLYFAGPLGPGRAIKWRTEAKGSHYRIDAPELGQLDMDGSTAAPSEAFRELLGARHRPVRLHAARMLAFLGDASAAQATLQLKDALRTAEAPYLRRLLAALAPIRVCDLYVSGEAGQRRATACVYNATDDDRDQLGLQVIALDRALTPDRPLDAPPTLLADLKWPLSSSLPAHSGARVDVPIELVGPEAERAVAFEMHADRFTLLE